MRIAEVIGKVTLSRWNPAVVGATWVIAVPLTHAELCGQQADNRAEPIVVYDERGAGQGHWIAVSESGEASAPFYPEQKPIDAYNSAILDKVDVEPICV